MSSNICIAKTAAAKQIAIEEYLIGDSAPMLVLRNMVRRVANSSASVMICGASGSGKEVVARAIHAAGMRASSPYVALNCGAIPAELIESELFGHERGAFTGAQARRTGHFENAHKGTLFLDEIGEMPLQVQSKILRVLQEGTFSRVGGNETLHTDVRIVCATNRNLEEEVAKRTFREDLFYRLNVVRVHIPPLRQRVDDIRLLAEYFLQKIANRTHTPPLKLTEEAVRVLESYPWPGNVRELENTIARACALASSQILLPADIPLASAPIRTSALAHGLDQVINAAPANTPLMSWVSSQIVGRMLDRSGGDLKETARALGVELADVKRILSPKD